MATQSRRRFLEDSLLMAASAAAASAIPSFASAAEKPSPNERINVAIVGAGSRGKEHIQAFLQSDCDISYIIDPCQVNGGVGVKSVVEATGKAPAFEADLRRALDDKSVDAISVASPNHWHALAAIWAMQAGKDVYVEKPVCHNISEGRRAVEAARKYNRICQSGTQCRSIAAHAEAVKFVRDGGIGEVKLARGLCYKRRKSIGPKGVYAPPPSVDYTLWQGPATDHPLTRPKFHYDWHWQFHWGNGDIGNQGPHQFDLCRWGLKIDGLTEKVITYGGRFGYEDAGETPNTQVAIHTSGDKTLVFEVRGLATEKYRNAMIAAVFYGSQGTVVSSYSGKCMAFDLDGKPIREFTGSGGHFGNFLKAVRSRNVADLNADILEGHRSAGLAHMSSICYQLGSPRTLPEIRSELEAIKCHDDCLDTLDRTVAHLKKNGVDMDATKMTLGPTLEMDSATETFKGNDAANAMLTREYRKGFEVPAAGQV